jgi:hypothetical protein
MLSKSKNFSQKRRTLKIQGVDDSKQRERFNEDPNQAAKEIVSQLSQSQASKLGSILRANMTDFSNKSRTNMSKQSATQIVSVKNPTLASNKSRTTSVQRTVKSTLQPIAEEGTAQV